MVQSLGCTSCFHWLNGSHNCNLSIRRYRQKSRISLKCMKRRLPRFCLKGKQRSDELISRISLTIFIFNTTAGGIIVVSSLNMAETLRACVLILLTVVCAGNTALSKQSCVSSELYVVPFLSFPVNGSDGTLMHPYSSLQQALDHVARGYDYKQDSRCLTRINLYPTRHFVGTIRFDHPHSRIRLTTMSTGHATLYRAQHPLSSASISGGIVVTGWNDMGNNTYSAVVSSPIFVNQLFVDDHRVVRTRVPTNPVDYLRYAAPLSDPDQALYGFQYAPGQFNYTSLTDAMVVVYHSWTTSHHYIDRLITAKRYNSIHQCSRLSNRSIRDPSEKTISY